MKYLFFLIAISFSFTIQAEVKPEGAMVPSMCGGNFLETPFAGPDYPATVCMMTVTVTEDSSDFSQYVGKKIVKITSGQGDKYILITGEFQDCGLTGVENWQGYELLASSGDDGKYSFPQGINLNSPRVELTAAQQGSNLVLRGDLFQVELEPVFNTLSR